MDPIGVCLALAAATAPGIHVPVQGFTLAWTHTIEKVRWEEDYRVQAATDPGAPPRLVATAARVKGSAAGMEPAPDARLRNGWFEYTPAATHPQSLRLSRSEFAADYELCTNGVCRPLGHWLPSDGGVTVLTACRAP
jgi:hypothetical protein